MLGWWNDIVKWRRGKHEGMEPSTPRTQTGYNNVSKTPREIGST
jgi:hypothetical protein